MNTWIIFVGWEENLFSIYFIGTYSFREGLIGKLNIFYLSDIDLLDFEKFMKF